MSIRGAFEISGAGPGNTPHEIEISAFIVPFNNNPVIRRVESQIPGAKIYLLDIMSSILLHRIDHHLLTWEPENLANLGSLR